MQVSLRRTLTATWAVSGAAAATLSVSIASAAQLSYSASSAVSGTLHSEYLSPYLGPISFDINGSADYQYWDLSNPAPLASASFIVAPGQTSGVDPVYDIVTGNGAYGFSYTGTAQVSGTGLHAQITTAQVDAGMNPVANTPNTSVTAYASSSWQQQFYIAPTADRPQGSYGAILVGLTLDGGFPNTIDGWGNAQLYAYTSFVDSSGVNYSSNFGISTWTGDPNWTGQSTGFKKLLFQYGTVFSLSSYLWTNSSGNATTDFLNTGKISSIEIPFGAVLDTGASQAGLGSLNALYGVVFNSPTADDQNTNWDFNNGGGGFTPKVPVPEPASWAMLALGLALLLWRRHGWATGG